MYPLPAMLGRLVEEIRHILGQSCPDTAAQDARYMVAMRSGFDQSAILLKPDQMIPADVLAALEGDLHRVLAGEPLSRIYGEREFWGLRFALSPDTLDPRPDTETLIEAALKRFKNKPPETILDLGTGSGCILIALLKEFPQARGVGVDRSYGALGTARGNAKAHGVAERAAFICGNWADSVNHRFDLVVSNPPYIANPALNYLSETVRNHDPILALDGGEDGLQAYRQIFLQLLSLLKPASAALFEIGFDQAASVSRLSEESRFLVAAIHPDLAGHPRVLEISPAHPCGDK